MRLKRFQSAISSALAFFATVLVLSVGYAAYSAIPTAVTGGTLSATGWNLVGSNLEDHESRIGTLASQVSALTAGSGGFWAAATGGITTSAGKVGIGTSTPNGDIHVYRSSGNAEIDIQSTSAANSHWGMYHNAADQSLRFWHTGANDVVTFSTGGNVGIGTAPRPGYKLDIAGNAQVGTGSGGVTVTVNGLDNTSDIGMRVEQSGILKWLVGMNNAVVDGNFSILQGGSVDRLVIDTSGNVGIGTGTPADKLDVRGNIVVSDPNVANQGNYRPVMAGGRKTVPTNQWVELFRSGETVSATLDSIAVGTSGNPTATFVSQNRIQVAYGSSTVTNVSNQALGSVVSNVQYQYLNSGGSENYIVRIYVTSTDPSVDLSWSLQGITAGNVHQL